MKCIRRPPSRFPSMLVSLGRMISVISDCVLVTVRTRQFLSGSFIASLRTSTDGIARGYNREWGGHCSRQYILSFGHSTSLMQISQSLRLGRNKIGQMDKIATLREILSLDPKNSFARYGIAMELVNRGEIDAGLDEYTALLASDPDYTAGYFMSAQTLSSAGRKKEAIERLKAGI